MRRRQGKKRRLFAAALATCLLLGGCSVIRDQNEAGAHVPSSILDLSANEYTGRVEKSAAIYYLNATSGTLTAQPLPLVIGQDANPAEIAVQQLLAGPYNDQLARVAPDGMRLEDIECSRDVANVYLAYDGEPMTARQKYILELALANTVTDMLGTTYTCIFYNGVQTGFSGFPYAPLQKHTGSVEDAWRQASAKYMPPAVPDEEAAGGDALPEPQEEMTQTVEIPTVLYFVSTDGAYILPEVRDVQYTCNAQFTDGDYAQKLIAELVFGPQDTAAMESPFADDLTLIDPPTLSENAEGEMQLTLNFSRLPTKHDFSDADDEMLSFAALIYTITGFVPGVERIQVSVRGTQIEAGGMRRQDYTGYMGGSAPLYFADKSSDLLLVVSRSMEQGKTWSARERVLQILRGPLSSDGDNAWPVMPSGVTQDDILSVNVYNDTAYVDLSQHFKDACAGLSPKNEMLLVYSIVNTVTAMDGTTKVQFLVEGAQTTQLAGHLCISDPFIKNYGIIKSSG